MKYKLHRVIKHNVFTNEKETLERHDIIYHKKSIILDEDDFLKLKELTKENEYKYQTYDKIIDLDMHPAVIEEHISNQEFLDAYIDGLDDNFHVSFYYKILL